MFFVPPIAIYRIHHTGMFMTLTSICPPSYSHFMRVVTLQSVCSECNCKVFQLGSPEAKQGHDRSCRGSGTGLCVCLCVCESGLGEVDGERDASGP